MLEEQEILQEVYSLIAYLKDPEKQSCTLEELSIVNLNGVFVKQAEPQAYWKISIELNPTNPHCSLMLQIGLSIHYVLQKELLNFQDYKVRLYCKIGSHQTKEEIDKQLNDKERIAAALQNSEIVSFLERLQIA